MIVKRLAGIKTSKKKTVKTLEWYNGKYLVNLKGKTCKEKYQNYRYKSFLIGDSIKYVD